MNTPTHSVHYFLDIYEKTFRTEPCVTFQATTPFMAFERGDLLDPATWETQTSGEPGTRYEVKHVLHRVWEISGSHIAHQVSIVIAPIVPAI